MRKGFFGKLLVTCCVLLGCMVGYGFVSFTGTGGGNIYNIINRTKDNTLDREKDSVFFSSDGEKQDVAVIPEEDLQEKNSVLESTLDGLFVEKENELNKIKEIEVTITRNPTITPKTVEEEKVVEEKEATGQTLLVTPVKEEDSEKTLEDSKENIGKKQEEEVVIGEKEISQNVVEGIEQESKEIEETEINISEIVAKGIKEKIENQTKETEKEENEIKERKIVAEGIVKNPKEVEKEEKEMKESEIIAEEIVENTKEIEKEMKKNTMVSEDTGKQKDITFSSERTEYEQVFTYPSEIFGQTPVVNRSDEYVTYFEFALDLIETVEDEVKARGLSETALFAKFAIKALFCGVDVKTIKINEPISRSEAALALWLTAQVMEEKGTETSAVNETFYITDLGNCSSSEKKAIAYLYEQGVLLGYQISGQTFLPSKKLKTEDGEVWMNKIKQCWK